jgi:hypothetical protein
MSLHRETLLNLQPEGLEAQARRVAGGNTGPSCEIYRACTIGGWDCTWAECSVGNCTIGC